MDMRQRYIRICELADHPCTIGFSKRYHKIVMNPEDAAQHILVRYSSFSTIEHTCYPTLSFLYFHSYSFTPLGIPQMTNSSSTKKLNTTLDYICYSVVLQ